MSGIFFIIASLFLFLLQLRLYSLLNSMFFDDFAAVLNSLLICAMVTAFPFVNYCYYGNDPFGVAHISYRHFFVF